jgi:hypothetical protein
MQHYEYCATHVSHLCAGQHAPSLDALRPWHGTGVGRGCCCETGAVIGCIGNFIRHSKQRHRSEPYPEQQVLAKCLAMMGLP